MKRTVTFIIIAAMLLSASASFADKISGKTTPQGQVGMYYESGTWAQSQNDMDKIFYSSYQELGALYGFTKNLSAGIALTKLSVMSYPGLRDSHAEWWYEGMLPGFFIAEYSFGKIAGMDSKVRLKHNLGRRRLSIDRNDPNIKGLRAIANSAVYNANLPYEDAVITVRDTALEFFGSAPITKAWNIGGSIGVVYSDYEGNDVAAAIKNLNDRTAVRINLGTDYDIWNGFFGYLLASQTLNSSAVGTYSEDAYGTIKAGANELQGESGAVVRDHFLTVVAGVKSEF